MITDDLPALLLFSHHELIFPDAAAHKVVSNANKAFNDEVHLCHLVLFLINDAIIAGFIKLSWHEPFIELSHEGFLHPEFI